MSMNRLPQWLCRYRIGICVLAFLGWVALAAATAAEEKLPAYLDIIDKEGKFPAYLGIVVDEGIPASKAAVATANIEALDTGMQQIYALSLTKYKAHMRERVPIIVARFSESGGAMTLMLPGEDPIRADAVPEIYSLVKSVSHAAMAVYQLVAPYLVNPGDTSWRAPMAGYLAQVKAARATLADLEVPDNVRTRLGRMMDKEIAFMEQCLKTGTFSLADLENFAHSVEPDIVKNVALAAGMQVSHWEDVLTKWKAKLGTRWDETYAITNTMYVTRQNNVIFTILTQFMGQEAIGDRLLLVGTTAFTTTEEKLLDVLTRIVADRALGKVFFRNYYLMDAELLGGAARHAIEVDATKKGKKVLLPKLAPFDTHQWPWPTDPKSGPGPAEMSEIPGD